MSVLSAYIVSIVLPVVKLQQFPLFRWEGFHDCIFTSLFKFIVSKVGQFSCPVFFLKVKDVY